jgi:homoserine dehydrogenase
MAVNAVSSYILPFLLLFFVDKITTAKIAYGVTIPPATIPTMGISGLSSQDFAAAQDMKCTIKLIGTAISSSSEQGQKLAVFVTPTLVPLGGALAAAKGPGNVVCPHFFLFISFQSSY